MFMKKSVIITIIIGIIIMGLIIVGLATTENYDIKKPVSTQKELLPEKSVVEGKNYVLKLDDAVSTASLP